MSEVEPCHVSSTGSMPKEPAASRRRQRVTHRSTRTEPPAPSSCVRDRSLNPAVLPRGRPMLRQTSNEDQILDRTAAVAATIAEEGLRYVSDSTPGYSRKRTGTTFSY